MGRRPHTRHGDRDGSRRGQVGDYADTVRSLDGRTVIALADARLESGVRSQAAGHHRVVLVREQVQPGQGTEERLPDRGRRKALVYKRKEKNAVLQPRDRIRHGSRHGKGGLERR